MRKRKKTKKKWMKKMRNRAKCRLCGDILESFHEHDLVQCRCKEIAITGGNYKPHRMTRHAENFILINDDGKEEAFTPYEEKSLEQIQEQKVMTKEEAIQELENMVKFMENMREQALYSHVTQCDLYRFMALLVFVLK